MKKLYVGAVAALMLIGVASCGTEKVLKTKECDGYAILGPATHAIGDEFIKEWGQFDGTGVGTMKATSVEAVKKFDKKLGTEIEKRKPKALYTIKNVEIATKANVDWTKTWGDDATVISGAYCLKVGQYTVDEETGKSVVSLWVPSKESGKVLSLTPDLYWVTPNFAEEKDTNGYDWNTDPIVIGGAGRYNVTVAEFKEPVDEASFGIGLTLVKKGVEFKNPETEAKVFKEWKLTGTTDKSDTCENGWDPSGALNHFSAENTLTLDLDANAEFKVTKFFTDNTGDWPGALDSSAVVEKDAEYLDLTKENIKVLTAGNYTLKVTEDTKLSITLNK